MIKKFQILPLLLTIFSFVIGNQAFAQSISGRVIDSKKDPIPFVTVILKGTQVSAISNQDGDFRIAAKQGSTLVFSSVGYHTLEKIANSNSITVQLEDKEGNLNEVVVVGYGIQKKMEVTGAVSIIDKKTIENRPVTNAIDAMQGTAPGLIITRSNGQPGKQNWDMNVRGFSSLNGTNNPLVIIDGVEGDMSQINPNDIESISVLKDAASAAIYGAKSSGGVVIVTTKKGTNTKTSISFSTLSATRVPMRIPNKPSMGTTALLQNLANKNAGLGPTWTDEQISWMNSTDNHFITNAKNPAQNGYYYDLNLIPIILKPKTNSLTNNISISGGGDKTQYLFSLGNYNEKGIFRYGQDKTDRVNARFNSNTKFNNFLSLDARLSYSNTSTLSPSSEINGDYGLLYKLYQIRQLYPIFLPNSDDQYLASGNDVYGRLLYGGTNSLKQDAFDGIFTLKIDNLIKGLSIRNIYSPQFLQIGNDIFNRSFNIYSYNSQMQPVVSSIANNPNSLTKSRITQFSHNFQFLVDYIYNFRENHHFHLLGGYQYQYFNYNYITATATNLVSNDLASLNYPTSPTSIPNGDDLQDNTWLSQFGRLTYDYKGTYIFEATLRNDASSRLAPGYRSQLFPAISGAWNVSNEKWFGGNSNFLISNLKVRASWGRLGNAQLGDLNTNNYNFIPLLSNTGAVNYPFNNTSNQYVFQSRLASPSLGWETIETSDVGADFGLFKNKLTGSFDYFLRLNNNMLIAINTPATLGVTPSTANAASMKTWGWELNLNWRERKANWNYALGFNIGDNKNEITKYLGNVVYQEGLNQAIPGLPINSIFGYKAEGYFSSSSDVSSHAFQDNRTGPGDIIYTDQNGDKVINSGIGTQENHGDLVYLGNTSPRYNFGLNGNLQYRDFDFSIFFQGTGKRNMMLYSYEIVPFINSWRNPYDINLDYWTPDNTNAKFPRLYSGGTHNTKVSSHWVQNASYIRLKNIQIGYNIPKKYIEKLKMQKARIFLSGQDIWEKTGMWNKYTDPENPNNKPFQYPLFRSYAVGLNVNF